MYQALYRKWRPLTFDDVVGQEHITETLRNELMSGKIAHAYLFTGSRGTGKTTLAKIFAKAVNCRNPVNGSPCLHCDICTGIDDGSILDVTEQDAASNNGVDRIRELRDETNFAPVAAKYRVYILDEAHMLSPGAVNALLKIMEEPPPHVIFILATTEAHKIPETLVSRCQRFDFHRMTIDQLTGRLRHIAQAEGAALPEDAAQRIASLVNGGMRDAVSLLDQAMAVSPEITVGSVNSVAGVADREHLFALAEAVRTGDCGAIFETVDQLYQRSFDVDRLCGDLHTWFRDLMLVKSCRSPERFVSTPADLPRLTQQAADMSLPTLLHAMTALQQAQLAITRAVSARAELETCLLKLTDPRLDASPEALLRRIEMLEKRQPTAIPQAQPQSPARMQPQPEAAAPQPARPRTPAVPETIPAAQPGDPEPWKKLIPPAQPDKPPVAGDASVPAAPSIAQVSAPAAPSIAQVSAPAAPSIAQVSAPAAPSIAQASALAAPGITPEAPADKPVLPWENPIPLQQTAASPGSQPPRAAAPRADPKPPVQPDTGGASRTDRLAEELSANAEPLPAEEWAAIRTAIELINPPLAGALEQSRAFLSGKRVLIDGSEFFLRMIREEPSAGQSLKTVLREHYGQPYSIGPYRQPKAETPVDRFERLAQTAREMGIELETEGE